MNRVRFAGVVHGHRLKAGTYRISIRAASGHVVRRVTLVVVDGPVPSQDELRSLQSANTCVGSDGAAPGSATSPTSTLKAPGPPAISPKTGASEGLAPSGPRLHGILGSSIAETARAIRPLLVALLVLAILLLSVASLPQAAIPDRRTHELLARHRIEVAGLGVAALVAVALAFLLA